MDYETIRVKFVNQSNLGNLIEENKKAQFFDINSNTNENYEKDREKYINEDLPKYIDKIYNTKPLSLDKINKYLEIWTKTTKGDDKDFKVPYVHEISKTESKKRKIKHDRAVKVLKEVLRKDAEREIVPTGSSAGFSRMGLSYITGMNISPDTFKSMELADKKQQVFKLLGTVEQFMKDTNKITSDEEYLASCEKNFDLWKVVPEVEPQKFNIFIKEIGLDKDPEVKNLVDGFFNKYDNIATSFTFFRSRIDMFANPYYESANIEEFLSAASLQSIFPSTIDNPDCDKFLEDNGISPNGNFKNNEEFIKSLENGTYSNPFKSFEGEFGLMNYKDNLMLDCTQEQGDAQIEDFINLKFIDKGGYKNIDFIDLKTGEKADCKDIPAGIKRGNSYLFKDDDGKLKELICDPTYGSIDVKEQVQTLNLTSKEEVDNFTKDILKDLKATKTNSLTQSKEYKKLEKAVKDLVSSKDGSLETKVEKTEKIVEAAKDYLKYRRFTKKAVNEKTEMRMDFANKVIEKLDGAAGLCKYLEKNKDLNKEETKAIDNKKVNLEATKAIVEKLGEQLATKDTKVVEEKSKEITKVKEKDLGVNENSK